jgi:hypothetical protein
MRWEERIRPDKTRPLKDKTSSGLVLSGLHHFCWIYPEDDCHCKNDIDERGIAGAFDGVVMDRCYDSCESLMESGGGGEVVAFRGTICSGQE